MGAFEIAVLFAAATLAGALNSVVGGGSFIAFPALLFAGVPPIAANATNCVALWPGSIASTVAYRREIPRSRATLAALGLASWVGGALGASLLLYTPSATFARLIPWLLLGASALFTFADSLTARLRGRASAGPDEEKPIPLVLGSIAQLVIAIYGGYFGGGMGILMFAAWSLLGVRDLHAMNALRSLLSVVINGTALVMFVIAGAVAWAPGVVMMGGAAVGGYAGAAISRRVDKRWLRRLVLAVAWSMTLFFFIRVYVR